MHDITERRDIEKLIRNFYDKVNKDELISMFFSHVDWDKHLPIMYDFWESVLFYTGNYSGNPMQAHQKLHARLPMLPEHFNRWKELFIATVNENFKGEKAELAITRASAIAYLMEQKITQSKN